MNNSSQKSKSRRTNPYSYVELLVDRRILRKNSRIVEGCIGNTGWDSSLHVARRLGTGGSYSMVDIDPIQVHQHRLLFEANYQSTNLGTPNLNWIVGKIEDQIELIKGADALLFHNYVPIDTQTLDGIKDGALERIRDVFRKLVDANPKHIALYLPNFKEPEDIAWLFKKLDVKCETVDKIDYAGNLGNEDRNKWLGKALIATIRS